MKNLLIISLILLLVSCAKQIPYEKEAISNKLVNPFIGTEDNYVHFDIYPSYFIANGYYLSINTYTSQPVNADIYFTISFYNNETNKIDTVKPIVPFKFKSWTFSTTIKVVEKTTVKDIKLISVSNNIKYTLK